MTKDCKDEKLNTKLNFYKYSESVHDQNQSPENVNIYIYGNYLKVHSIFFFIAIFMSFRCHKGFNPLSFLFACSLPEIFILYVLATKDLKCFFK